MTLFSATSIFGFIKHRAVLHKDCTKPNNLQKGKIWRLSHSTGCLIENAQSHFSDAKDTKPYHQQKIMDSVMKLCHFNVIFNAIS